jgi:hypothetical protein
VSPQVERPRCVPRPTPHGRDPASGDLARFWLAMPASARESGGCGARFDARFSSLLFPGLSQSLGPGLTLARPDPQPAISSPICDSANRASSTLFRAEAPKSRPRRRRDGPTVPSGRRGLPILTRRESTSVEAYRRASMRPRRVPRRRPEKLGRIGRRELITMVRRYAGDRGGGLIPHHDGGSPGRPIRIRHSTATRS